MGTDCPGCAQLARVLARLEAIDAKLDNLAVQHRPKVTRAAVCTPSQAEVLRAFHRLTRLDRRPTLQEVADETGHGVSYVQATARRLAERGLMRRETGCRGWTVTEAAAPLIVAHEAQGVA